MADFALLPFAPSPSMTPWGEVEIRLWLRAGVTDALIQELRTHEPL